MSKIIHYLDSQSDIRLLADAQLYYQEIRTTDLLFLLQGKAELVVDGKKSVMKKDDIIVINKQESYKLLAEEGSLLFHFSISQYLLSQALEVEREGFYCNSIEQPNRNYQSIRQSIISIIDLLLFENDKTNFLHISKIYQLLNGLTDEWHPTQMIADFLTIQENFGELTGLTIAYCGDGRNNVANSLLVTSAILGVNIHVVTPKALQPEATIIAQAQAYAKESGAKILVTDDVDQGVLGADVVYTDVWVSMGEEEKFQERIEQLLPYQVNQSLMKKTQNDQVIFMHCLPAFHDDQTTYGKKAAQAYGISEMEVTDEVFRSKYARQFDQAENRLHSIKAVMAVTAGDLFIPKV